MLCNIRRATVDDQEIIRDIYLSAFPKEEAQQIADLAIGLLLTAEKEEEDAFSLVAEVDNKKIIGHVAFSPIKIDNNIRAERGFILAPLAVHPDFQKSGIGSKLVQAGKEKLINMNVHILLVYGDPKYYSRFGFNTELAKNYIPPYKMQWPHGWQATVLSSTTDTTTSSKSKSSSSSAHKISCVKALCKPDYW